MKHSFLALASTALLGFAAPACAADTAQVGKAAKNPILLRRVHQRSPPYKSEDAAGGIHAGFAEFLRNTEYLPPRFGSESV